MLLASLNLQYMGRVEEAVTCLEPTAAQRRVQTTMHLFVESFLREDLRFSGEQTIRDHLRQPVSGYGRGHAARALGLRAGVPDRAGTVALSDELRDHAPELAEQVEEPSRLLLKVSDRPEKMPRMFARLDATYPAYVKRNVKCGLQQLRARRRIFKVKGKPLLNGAFAVEKSEDEDRAIANLIPTNSLLNEKLMWKPVFPMMNGLRAMVARPGHKLCVWKRDGRHFPPTSGGS